MPKQKLTKCEIRWSQSAGIWCLYQRIDNKWFYVMGGCSNTKSVFMRLAVAFLTERVADYGDYGFSLIVRKKNGEYQDEITIPRSHDPKKSKG